MATDMRGLNADERAQPVEAQDKGALSDHELFELSAICEAIAPERFGGAGMVEGCPSSVCADRAFIFFSDAAGTIVAVSKDRLGQFVAEVGDWHAWDERPALVTEHRLSADGVRELAYLISRFGSRVRETGCGIGPT